MFRMGSSDGDAMDPVVAPPGGVRHVGSFHAAANVQQAIGRPGLSPFDAPHERTFSRSGSRGEGSPLPGALRAAAGADLPSASAFQQASNAAFLPHVGSFQSASNGLLSGVGQAWTGDRFLGAGQPSRLGHYHTSASTNDTFVDMNGRPRSHDGAMHGGLGADQLLGGDSLASAADMLPHDLLDGSGGLEGLAMDQLPPRYSLGGSGVVPSSQGSIATEQLWTGGLGGLGGGLGSGLGGGLGGGLGLLGSGMFGAGPPAPSHSFSSPWGARDHEGAAPQMLNNGMIEPQKGVGAGFGFGGGYRGDQVHHRQQQASMGNVLGGAYGRPLTDFTPLEQQG